MRALSLQGGAEKMTTYTHLRGKPIEDLVCANCGKRFSVMTAKVIAAALGYTFEHRAADKFAECCDAPNYYYNPERKIEDYFDAELWWYTE
jgi:uncharacterized protein YlaI